MKDARSIDSIAMRSVQAIPFSQKNLDRIRVCWRQRFANLPCTVKTCRGPSPINPGRSIDDLVFALLQIHPRIEVRQVIESPRPPNRERVRRVQRKKPNARHSLEMNIGAYIQLVKGTCTGNRRQEGRTNSP